MRPVLLTDLSPFPVTAEALRRCVDAAMPGLRSIASDEAARPLAPGKWSPKQVIGHLIDSAANNHQRFVRAQQAPALVFPEYAQDHWVAVQHYQDREWEEVTAFWQTYNHHLAHLIERIPEDRRDVMCTIGGNAPVTLGFLTCDYIVHLRHHLRQVRVWP